MPRPLPRLPRRRVAAPAMLAAPVILLTLLGACTGSGEDPGARRPSPSATGPTPLADYDASGLSLARTSPCPALDEDAVARALGDEATGSTSYAAGERARLSAGLRDVAQEAGCVFRGQGGTTARAWTFAPPVRVARARAVARTLAREEGCRRVQDAPAFGKPGVARTCRRGPRVVGSYGGLFGDAWLGCSVAVPRSAARGAEGRSALVRRTGEWCVQVVEAARQAREEDGSATTSP